MSGNAISPLLAFLGRSPSFYGLLKVSRPSHPASTCLSRLPTAKEGLSQLARAPRVCKVDIPPTRSERESILAFYLSASKFEIKLPHKFPPSHAGCAAVYLRGVACNLRLAAHCMFYLSGVEEEDVPKKQTVLLCTRRTMLKVKFVCNNLSTAPTLVEEC